MVGTEKKKFIMKLINIKQKWITEYLEDWKKMGFDFTETRISPKEKNGSCESCQDMGLLCVDRCKTQLFQETAVS